LIENNACNFFFSYRKEICFFAVVKYDVSSSGSQTAQYWRPLNEMPTVSWVKVQIYML